MQTASARVLPPTAKRQRALWNIWEKFVHNLGPIYPHDNYRDPFLRYTLSHRERIQTLLLFTARLRSGELSASGNPVGTGTVDEALRAISSAFQLAGFDDPRKQPGRTDTDYLLSSVLRAWRRDDPTPHRVRPFPIQLLQHVADNATTHIQPHLTQFRACRRDLIIIAFFYLLRSGEYTARSSDNVTHPFTLADVDLWHGHTKLNIQTATNAQLLTATRSYLTFSTQKNGVRGEKVGHATTKHPNIDPTAALARRIVHLRQHHASPDTPLAHYYYANRQFKVTAHHITSHLKFIATFFGEPLGFTPLDVSSHSLRAGGATALFCAGVSIDQIRLLGRWQSDTVFRYLHAQALPTLDAIAQRMLTDGGISLIPAPTI
jgi:hypothetical protein